MEEQISNWKLILDVINFLLAIAVFALLVQIVFRTKKGLDKVFKVLSVAALFGIAATAVKLNGYLEIFSSQFSQNAFNILRFLFLLSFFAAARIMIGILDRESGAK